MAGYSTYIITNLRHEHTLTVPRDGGDWKNQSRFWISVLRGQAWGSRTAPLQQLPELGTNEAE